MVKSYRLISTVFSTFCLFLSSSFHSVSGNSSPFLRRYLSVHGNPLSASPSVKPPLGQAWSVDVDDASQGLLDPLWQPVTSHFGRMLQEETGERIPADNCTTGYCACEIPVEPKETWQVALEWIAIIILICLSALFSGLTLGLLGLDLVGLEVVIGGDPDSTEAKYARTILPLRRRGNLLLCTLLLGNTAVNSLMSILWADKTSGLVGFFVSTFVILLFGEIIPQATCSRHALKIGAHSIYIVKFFMVVLFPVTYPLSRVLDCIFDEEIGSIYTTTQLTKLLEVHVRHKMLDEEQAKMMGGAMDFRKKLVDTVMTPADKIFALPVTAVLDFKTISEIFKSGFSRIPVYGKDRNDVVGLLLTKDLIVIDPEECTSVRSMVQFFGRTVHWLWPDSKLSDALALFKSGKAHLAMVHTVNNDVEETDPFYEVVGLITLEDIIEEIIQDEIVDETDLYVDMEDEGSRMDRSTFDYARLRLLDARHGNELTREECDAVTAHLANNVAYLAEALQTGRLTYDTLKQIVRRATVSEIVGPEYGKKNRRTVRDELSRGDTKISVTAEDDGEDDGKKKKKGTIQNEKGSMDVPQSNGSAERAPVTPRLSIDESGNYTPYDATCGSGDPFVLYKRGVPHMYCTLVLTGKLEIMAGREEFVSEKGPWTVLGTVCLKEDEYVPDFTATVIGEGARIIQLSKETVDDMINLHATEPVKPVSSFQVE